jgi:LAO/AO transport system kinase
MKMDNEKTQSNGDAKQAQIERLLANRKKRKAERSAEHLAELILAGDQQALSESITLLESTLSADQEKAQLILKACLGNTGKALRIGITGVPGVGKSTFIEAFGSYLADQGKKVAVMAIDPSSEISHGSILGDKTRMQALSIHPNAFIRPTATSGSLGGVARRTRETILLCEAAGYDIIFVETVGVGQSETEVHAMTDFFLLLMLAGAGDELQGIKRGIMEMADTILITKTDGKNVKKANLARTEYKNALHLFPPSPNEWIPKVETVSAIEQKGIEKVWKIIEEFQLLVTSNGWLAKRRNQQDVYWMKKTVQDTLLHDFYQTAGVDSEVKLLEDQIKNGTITSFQAARKLLTYYKDGKNKI